MIYLFMVTRALGRTEYINIQRKFYIKLQTRTTAVDEIGGVSPLPLPDSILFGISGDFSDTVPPVNPTTRQAALSR